MVAHTIVVGAYLVDKMHQYPASPTPIHGYKCARDGHFDKMIALIHVFPEQAQYVSTESRYTPLHQAAWHGDLLACGFLLGCGGVNTLAALNANLETPADVAERRNHKECATRLRSIGSLIPLQTSGTKVTDHSTSNTESVSSLQSSDVQLIGITGCSRCGKSWLARILNERLNGTDTPIQVIGQDRYWTHSVTVTLPDGRFFNQKICLMIFSKY